MTAKLLVSITTVMLMLSGCSHVLKSEASTTSQPQQTPNNSPVLATLTNLNVSPLATQGNSAVLMKNNPDFCTIEFTGFYDIGKVVEQWDFSNDALISASTSKIIYKNLEQDPALKQPQTHPVAFDISQPEKIENFHNLRSNFSKDVLQYCNW